MVRSAWSVCEASQITSASASVADAVAIVMCCPNVILKLFAVLELQISSSSTNTSSAYIAKFRFDKTLHKMCCERSLPEHTEQPTHPFRVCTHSEYSHRIFSPSTKQEKGEKGKKKKKQNKIYERKFLSWAIWFVRCSREKVNGSRENSDSEDDDGDANDDDKDDDAIYSIFTMVLHAFCFSFDLIFDRFQHISPIRVYDVRFRAPYRNTEIQK